MQGISIPLCPFGDQNSPPGLTVNFHLTILSKNHLRLVFEILGNLNVIDWGSDNSQVAGRATGQHLWEKTCFEFFLGSSVRAEYIEINVSPSGQWNVYRFDSYRSGMKNENDLSVLGFSRSSISKLEGEFHRAEVQFDLLAEASDCEILKLLGPGGFQSDGLLAAPSLILHHRNSKVLPQIAERSYWAPRHAKSQPDFHFQQNFVKINT